MDLTVTGQLSNLSTALEKLLEAPLPREPDRERHDIPHPGTIFRWRPYEHIRNALVREMPADGSGIRLKDLRQLVELRLGETVDRNRFKDYVNDQSRGANALLERVGYGVYRLRR